MNATALVYLNHRFDSFAYKHFMGEIKLVQGVAFILLSNIINKVINISLIIFIRI